MFSRGFRYLDPLPLGLLLAANFFLKCRTSLSPSSCSDVLWHATVMVWHGIWWVCGCVCGTVYRSGVFIAAWCLGQAHLHLIKCCHSTWWQQVEEALRSLRLRRRLRLRWRLKRRLRNQCPKEYTRNTEYKHIFFRHPLQVLKGKRVEWKIYRGVYLLFSPPARMFTARGLLPQGVA